MITTKPHRKGFTLVEMLVVLAIIATLASISYAIAQSVINRSKVQETKLRMLEIEEAINDFNEDHGRLPFADNTYPSSEEALFEGSFRPILRGLLGLWQDSANDGGENTTGKVYLTMPDAKGNKNGITYFKGERKSVRAVVDSWGKNFYIKIDYNLDSDLTQRRSEFGGELIQGRNVIIISDGPDGEPNTEDDIFSWK